MTWLDAVEGVEAGVGGAAGMVVAEVEEEVAVRENIRGSACGRVSATRVAAAWAVALGATAIGAVAGPLTNAVSRPCPPSRQWLLSGRWAGGTGT